MRKDYLNNEETGYFRTQKREAVVKNPMTGKTLTLLNDVFSFIAKIYL